MKKKLLVLGVGNTLLMDEGIGVHAIYEFWKERENWDEFKAFHSMLIELSEFELAETQIFIVDKELFDIHEEYPRSVFTRHMDPDSDSDPPLIPYYRGS